MKEHKRKEEPEKEENLERWLLTYSDLITLLLTLFVVMFAMSNVEQAKVEQLSESLYNAFLTGYSLIKFENLLPYKIVNSGKINTGKSDLPKDRFKTKEGSVIITTLEKAKKMLASELAGNLVAFDTNERGLYISLAEDLYFYKAKDELLNSSVKTLEKIADFLIENNAKNIRVEGYTDNYPTEPDGPWESNWELGASRAITILKYLEDFGVAPDRLSAATYGEYKPITANRNEEERSKNRRVVIAVLNDEKY